VALLLLVVVVVVMVALLAPVLDCVLAGLMAGLVWLAYVGTAFFLFRAIVCYLRCPLAQVYMCVCSGSMYV
jgi:hypothetical protein